MSAVIAVRARPCRYEGIFISVRYDGTPAESILTREISNVAGLAAAIEEARTRLTGRDMNLFVTVRKGDRKPPGFDRWMESNRRLMNVKAEPQVTA
jgi:hypothetical protein